MGNPVPNLCQR